ncbi:MAG: SRPBCC family protein [Chitinophagaceae bacterium]|jgi:hypothetical protein|nr:SRPBCC family protein [Chitinophagaceae bacterium]
MIIIYILAGLIVGLLIMAAFMPNKYRIEKSVIISRSPSDIKEKIVNLENYSRWNPWQQMDPAAQKRITGRAGAPGHKYEWNGKKVGNGSLTLYASDDRTANFDLEFIKPMKSKAKDNWQFEPISENETRVTWDNNGELPYPTARLIGPFLKKNLEKQFTAGLDNLKKMCENC